MKQQEITCVTYLARVGFDSAIARSRKILKTASKKIDAKKRTTLSGGGSINVSHPVKCHTGSVSL